MCLSDAETLQKLVDKEKKKIEAEQEKIKKKEDCDRKRIQAQLSRGCYMPITASNQGYILYIVTT